MGKHQSKHHKKKKHHWYDPISDSFKAVGHDFKEFGGQVKGAVHKTEKWWEDTLHEGEKATKHGKHWYDKAAHGIFKGADIATHVGKDIVKDEYEGRKKKYKKEFHDITHPKDTLKKHEKEIKKDIEETIRHPEKIGEMKNKYKKKFKKPKMDIGESLKKEGRDIGQSIRKRTSQAIEDHTPRTIKTIHDVKKSGTVNTQDLVRLHSDIQQDTKKFRPSYK